MRELDTDFSCCFQCTLQLTLCILLHTVAGLHTAKCSSALLHYYTICICHNCCRVCGGPNTQLRLTGREKRKKLDKDRRRACRLNIHTGGRGKKTQVDRGVGLSKSHHPHQLHKEKLSMVSSMSHLKTYLLFQ